MLSLTLLYHIIKTKAYRLKTQHGHKHYIPL